MSTFRGKLTGSNITPGTEVPAAATAPAPQPAAVSTTEGGQPAPAPDPVTVRDVPKLPPDPREAGMEFIFDDFGRARLVTREQAAAYNGQEPAQPAPAEAPALPAQPAAPSAPAGGDQITALQNQVNQLTHALGLVTQAQLDGVPLKQVLGQPAQPKAPTPPDPSKYDLYDARQAAQFYSEQAQYMQQAIQHGVREALAPYNESMEATKWQGQYQGIQQRHGSDPQFQQKADAAIRLVMKDPTRLTIPEAYDIINGLMPASSAAPAQPKQVADQPAARTITPAQAQQKAEQAARLPRGNSGVTGAGRAQLPKHVKGLGAIMAWNAQHRDS